MNENDWKRRKELVEFTSPPVRREQTAQLAKAEAERRKRPKLDLDEFGGEVYGFVSSYPDETKIADLLVQVPSMRKRDKEVFGIPAVPTPPQGWSEFYQGLDIGRKGYLGDVLRQAISAIKIIKGREGEDPVLGDIRQAKAEQLRAPVAPNKVKRNRMIPIINKNRAEFLKAICPTPAE